MVCRGVSRVRVDRTKDVLLQDLNDWSVEPGDWPRSSVVTVCLVWCQTTFEVS